MELQTGETNGVSKGVVGRRAGVGEGAGCSRLRGDTKAECVGLFTSWGTLSSLDGTAGEYRRRMYQREIEREREIF